jgi:hypothetical protein
MVSFEPWGYQKPSSRFVGSSGLGTVHAGMDWPLDQMMSPSPQWLLLSRPDGGVLLLDRVGGLMW